MIIKTPESDAPATVCGKHPWQESQGQPEAPPPSTAHSQACLLLRQDLDAQLDVIHQAIEGIHLDLIEFSKALDRYLAFISQE